MLKLFSIFETFSPDSKFDQYFFTGMWEGIFRFGMNERKSYCASLVKILYPFRYNYSNLFFIYLYEKQIFT